MLAIEMVGGVYCPLSPVDPQHRLEALIAQTKAHSIYVHYITKTRFQSHIIPMDIDYILFANDVLSDNDINILTNVLVSFDNIAYIIFTSGSTGTPKAVSNQMKTMFK